MYVSSKVYVGSIETNKAAKSCPASSPVAWLLQEMDAEAVEKITILFRTTHPVDKHLCTFIDYIWLF